MKKLPVFATIGLCFILVGISSVFATQEAKKEYETAKNGAGNADSWRRKGARPIKPRSVRLLSRSEIAGIGQANQEFRGKREAELKKNIELVAPGEADIAEHSVFLGKENTGIVKLLPFVKCENERVVAVDEECLRNVPGASEYSFNKKIHAFGFYPDVYDISLRDGQIVSNGFLTMGFLVSLGNIEIEKISLDTQGVGFMTKFKPETDNNLARLQFERFSNGVESGGFFYSNKMDAKLNRTYILRSVAYRIHPWLKRLRAKHYKKAEMNPDWMKFRFILGDKRYDSTIAFRVIRKSENGEITLLWKMLMTDKSPKLRFKKSEALRDFKN